MWSAADGFQILSSVSACSSRSGISAVLISYGRLRQKSGARCSPAAGDQVDRRGHAAGRDAADRRDADGRWPAQQGWSDLGTGRGWQRYSLRCARSVNASATPVRGADVGWRSAVEVTQRQLRAFCVVAEELNFSRAAARLHMSQPALSLSVQQLERALGVRLLERNTRIVALTDAGRDFLSKLVPALEALDEALASARDWASGAVGSLRIGYLIGAGLEELPRLLRDFSRRYPHVRVEAVECDFGDPTAGLGTASVDVALIRPPIDLAVETMVLSREGWVACVPADHPFAGRAYVDLNEVLAEPIIAAPSSAGLWRDYWIAAEYRLTTPATVVAEAATFESEFNTVAQGKGISITTETARRYYLRPGVAFVPIRDAPPCTVALAWLPGPHAPAVAQFLEVARDLQL